MQFDRTQVRFVYNVYLFYDYFWNHGENGIRVFYELWLFGSLQVERWNV